MADRQFKSLPYFAIKAAEADGNSRVRKGIAAVFGNIDSVGDRIMPGAFQKTITEGRKRVKHLWNHDFSTPPIASITELKEVSRDELPPEVLAYAPEATGGLMVSREYYKTDLADWVLQAIDKGDVAEMSFGFNIIREQKAEHDGQDIRELKELMLMDTSDVNWGANSATVTVGAKSVMPIGILLSHLNTFAAEVKAGRRNASADMELIKGMHGALVTLGYSDCNPNSEAMPKALEPEPSQTDTSLNSRRLELQRLELELLTI